MAQTIEERVRMMQLFSKYENAHELQRSFQHISSSFADDYRCESDLIQQEVLKIYHALVDQKQF